MLADTVTFALPKGRLIEPSLNLLADLGLPTFDIKEDSRSLLFEFSEQGLRYIICRPTDVPAYVEHGAADLGIVGKDIIVEQGKDVFEMVDLGFGYCRFVVAVPAQMKDISLEELSYRRVATKFPNVAAEFFRQQGLQVDIVKLHGNIELAPLMGISDMIVDIVSTGRTLAENNLVELVQIMESTARLIVNRISYRVKYHKLQPLIDRIRYLVKNGEVRQ
ncbi:MAG: ATP phosphoribosyltransferase [Syntrophothermus sp.]|uniref:ATP phosphoribosyltransferase n=1 Tax=Syntrophothermus sp. TaxID=2736299 RepID=UPI00257B4D71|nr:ATP phosphoribosyltransferase [Syntrophothermus sp.]NSW82912.1 ATP phosphoribosyltransferase [Syntrophothermus sp.]